MKKSGIFIYPLMLAAVVASFLLLVFAYILKCPSDIPARKALSEQPPEVFENGRMTTKSDIDGLNARLLALCEESELITDSLKVEGIACVFGNQTVTDNGNKLYINVADGNLFNLLFSFNCRWEASFDKNATTVNFSDIRLGKFEIPYLGSFFWRMLKLPETVSAPVKRHNGLLYLSSVRASDNGALTFTYDYDTEALAKTLNEILTLSDERKTEFHRVNGTVDEALLQIAEKKSVSPEEAVELITRFEKSPDSFPKLCWLLNSEGIHRLCAEFGEAYYGMASADKLVEASENELDSGLDDFHKQFTRLLLQHLYRNPDYTVVDGSLYLHGSEITPETVMAGTENPVYDVKIQADGKTISAIYSFSGYSAERVILTS